MVEEGGGGGYLPRTAGEDPPEKTYKHRGSQKRQRQHAIGDAGRKERRTVQSSAQASSESVPGAEFTVEGTGTGSGSKRDKPLTTFQSPAGEENKQLSTQKMRKERVKMKSRRIRQGTARTKSQVFLESQEALTAARKSPRKEPHMTIRGGINPVEVRKSSALKTRSSSREKDLLSLPDNSAKECEGDAPTAEALELQVPGLRTDSTVKPNEKLALPAAGRANDEVGLADGSLGEAVHPRYCKCGQEGSVPQRLVSQRKEIGTQSVVNATVACAAASVARIPNVQNRALSEGGVIQNSDVVPGTAKPTNGRAAVGSIAAGSVSSSKIQAADDGNKFPEETCMDTAEGDYSSGAFGSEVHTAPEMELEVCEEPEEGPNTSTKRTSRDRETHTKESLQVHVSAVEVERAAERVLKLSEEAPSTEAAPSVEGRVSGTADFSFITPVEGVRAAATVSSERRAGSEAGILRRSPEVWRNPSTGSNLQGGGERGSGPVVQSVPVAGSLQRDCAWEAEDPTAAVRVADMYSKSISPSTDPPTSAGNKNAPSAGQNIVTPVLVASTCRETEAMVRGSTNTEGQKSNEDVVREQLEKMLQRLPTEERSKWLLEAAQNVVTNSSTRMEDRKKANCNYAGSTSKKFKLKSQKGHGSSGNNAPRMVEVEEAAMKEREAEERAVREKIAKRAARRKKKEEEKGRKEKEEEEERRKGVEEFDMKIRELEMQKSMLLLKEKRKSISGLPPSPQRSLHGRRSKKSGIVIYPKSTMKEYKNFSEGKVKSTRPAVSSDGSRSTTCSDPLMLGVWESPKDMPPIELNSSLHPTGRYWDHLSSYAFKRAAMTFPSWDVPWPQQNHVRKTLFIERLKELYPGRWDAVWLLSKVGANIRQRRVRMRNNFKKFNRKENAPLPPGLALRSWNAIYESLSNPKYQEKSDKCKVAAEERSKKKPFSHKLGPRGVAGLLQKFDDEFDRQPTETEIEFGKYHGIPALIEYAHGRLKPAQEKARGGGISAAQVGEDHEPEEGSLVLHRPLRTGRRKRKMPVQSSSDSEGIAHTSSSDDEAEYKSSGKLDSGDSTEGEVNSDEEDNNGNREDCGGVSSEEEMDDNAESTEQ